MKLDVSIRFPHSKAVANRSAATNAKGVSPSRGRSNKSHSMIKSVPPEIVVEGVLPPSSPSRVNRLQAGKAPGREGIVCDMYSEGKS